MRLVLTCALLARASTAQAEVGGVIDAGNGAVINLHKEAGICTEGAKRAEFVSLKPAHTVEGCWRPGTRQPVLSIGWQNGRVDVVPLSFVQAPKVF